MLSILGEEFSINILKYFLFFFTENKTMTFHQIVSLGGDNLHEMSRPVFWKKNKKNIISLSFAECAERIVKINIIIHVLPLQTLEKT